MLPISDRDRRPLRPLQVLDQILDRADLQPPSLAEPEARVPPHHAVVAADLRDALDLLAVLHQLRDHARRRLPGQPAELDRGLGVPLALADAAGPRLQGQDVARSPEVLGAHVRGGECAAGQGAVVGGYASRDGGVAGVDGDGVGGALGVSVVGDHLGKVEATCQVGKDRCANEAAVFSNESGD